MGEKFILVRASSGDLYADEFDDYDAARAAVTECNEEDQEKCILVCVRETCHAAGTSVTWEPYT